MFIAPCIIVIVEEWKTNLKSFAISFHFLCAQHVSDINISITRSLRLFCWITTLVVLFLVRCVLEFRCGLVGVVSVLQASLQRRTKNNKTNVVIQQNSRKLLMMDILMSETCWAHKKWNKIASDIKIAGDKWHQVGLLFFNYSVFDPVQKFFFFLTIQTGSGTQSVCSLWVPRVLSPGVKRPLREVDHWSAPDVEVKN